MEQIEIKKRIINEKDEVCPICGKPSELINSGYFQHYEFQCNCNQQIQTKKHIKKRNIRKFSSLKAKIKKADFGYINRNVRLKKLDCEHIDVANKYITMFQPRKQKGLFIYGHAGNGKTSLAIAIGKELILKGYSVRFMTVSRAIRQLQKSYSNNSDFMEEVKKLAKTDLLILDDFGREAYKDRTLTDVFDFLDYLYTNCNNIIFTANTEQLEKIKTIPDMQAILDRLHSMTRFIKFNGKSLRRKG